MLLLLLLLLLRARVEAREHWARLDDDARSRLFRRRHIRRTHRHRDAQLALGFAFVDAASGRDVRIIAANGYANVAISTDQVVGRVEGGPAQAGDQGLDPGVRCSFEGAILLAVLSFTVKQVAADVAAGDAEGASERDHDLSEILAKSLSALQCC